MGAINIDKLLSKLDKVRETKPYNWMACCPAHDDKNPSLSIRLVSGRILTYCHSHQCSYHDVLNAVGLQNSDFFDDKWQAAYSHACCNEGKRLTKEIDQTAAIRDIDLRVIQIAMSVLESGEVLDIEDQSRFELALERIQ